MTEVTISGNTEEEAIQEGLIQLGVVREAVEVEVLANAHDDTLPGAEPLPGVTVRLRVKTDLLVKQAKEHLRKIMELVGIDAKIEVLNRKRGTVLNIFAGEDGALVIGKNGQNLDALQYLINRMVFKGTREISMIFVDSEGYREKHISRLEEIGKRAAHKAMRTLRDVELEPMSAGDRKIIHMALKEMRGVHTISRGENEERHIVVTPVPNEIPRDFDRSHGGHHGGGGRGGLHGDRGRGGRGGGFRGGRGGQGGGGFRGGRDFHRGGGQRPRSDQEGNPPPPPAHDDFVDEDEDNKFNR